MATHQTSPAGPRPKVLLDVPFPPFLRELFERHCELLPWETLRGGGEVLGEVVAVLSFAHVSVGDPELQQLPGLKVISNYGMGVDHIDLEAAARHGLPVGNTPGAIEGATADLAFALLLAVARNLVVGDRFARGPDFHVFDPGYLLGTDVHGATLGIVGMGGIGKRVARRARAFDMTVLYHNRRRDPAGETELGARYVALDELLARSDFVTLHVPLTEATRDLIGERELGLMQRHAFLVNTARGAVVSTDALYRALDERRIAGAALDVTEPEPLPRDHPLLGLDNLVITPHLGTSTTGTRLRMGEMALENLLAGLAGRPLPYEVRAGSL